MLSWIGRSFETTEEEVLEEHGSARPILFAEQSHMDLFVGYEYTMH